MTRAHCLLQLRLRVAILPLSRAKIGSQHALLSSSKVFSRLHRMRQRQCGHSNLPVRVRHASLLAGEISLISGGGLGILKAACSRLINFLLDARQQEQRHSVARTIILVTLCSAHLRIQSRNSNPRSKDKRLPSPSSATLSCINRIVIH